eukprot:SAG11_NODE_854_length_6864_cov_6.972087_8_plen_68_part_00
MTREHQEEPKEDKKGRENKRMTELENEKTRGESERRASGKRGSESKRRGRGKRDRKDRNEEERKRQG